MLDRFHRHALKLSLLSDTPARSSTRPLSVLSGLMFATTEGLGDRTQGLGRREFIKKVYRNDP